MGTATILEHTFDFPGPDVRLFQAYETYILRSMPRVSMLISDDDLALIDAAASPNRTAFMVAAAKEAAERIRRAREDDEIATICAATADRDRDLAAELSGTLADGL